MDMHKERCKKLKEIRKKIADKIGVDLHQTECTYEGKCSGTCPKCQQEERQLNQALLTKGALATGALAMSVSLVGCTIQEPMDGDVQVQDPMVTTEDYLEGDTTYEGAETYNPDEVELEGMAVPVDDEELQELEGDVVCVPEEEE
ncbi:MAG: hypothetical protein IJ040_03190 [Lachnospiraceae bacterium]|nr:hypothetical protein [Lachnospiraceae bacterium]